MGPNLSMRFDNITYFIDIFRKILNLEACTFNSWEFENWQKSSHTKSSFINIFLKLSSICKFGKNTSLTHRNVCFNLHFELLRWKIAAQIHVKWSVLITRKELMFEIRSKKYSKLLFSKNSEWFFCPKLHSNKSSKPFIYSFSSFFRIWWNVVYRKLTFFLHKIFKPGKIFFGRPNFQNFLLFVNYL